MNQPRLESGLASSWLLIAGLFLGAALLGFMAWDSSAAKRDYAAASGDVVEVTGANWQSEVLESKVPVLVDFGATWCGPCRDLAPTIDRLAEQYKGQAKVCKVDIDKAPEIAKRLGITGVPHVFIFYAGEIQESIPSVRPKEVYTRKLDALLAHIGSR
jgi:thioredoxin 1